jgi:hypothetical protein
VLEQAGGTAKVIMSTYDLTEPTIDLQLINLSEIRADVFYNISTAKATSQSIRKVAELWLETAAPAVRRLDRTFHPERRRLRERDRHRCHPLCQGSRGAAGKRIPT